MKKATRRRSLGGFFVSLTSLQESPFRHVLLVSKRGELHDRIRFNGECLTALFAFPIVVCSLLEAEIFLYMSTPRAHNRVFFELLVTPKVLDKSLVHDLLLDRLINRFPNCRLCGRTTIDTCDYEQRDNEYRQKRKELVHRYRTSVCYFLVSSL